MESCLIIILPHDNEYRSRVDGITLRFDQPSIALPKERPKLGNALISNRSGSLFEHAFFDQALQPISGLVL